METIVPPVTTPGLTPGTDNGGVGGSLDVSGSGLEGLKPGISVNVSVQGGLDGLVASLKLNINNRLFQIPVKLNLTANTQTLRLPENRPYPAEIKITASRPESLSFKFVTIDGQPPEKFVQTLRLPQQMPAAEKMPLINHTGSELKPEVQLHNLNFKSIAENLSALARNGCKAAGRRSLRRLPPGIGRAAAPGTGNPGGSAKFENRVAAGGF